MAQAFHRWTNVGSKGSILGGVMLLALATWVGIVIVSSSYGTAAGVAPVQPIPFSHEHHVGILGIDCRYCHASVESASFAGMPATKTCMNCHSQMWVGSQMLAPVRASYANNRSIEWKRVYNLPGFVYFDHSIHIHKGIGCSTCHGEIDRMPFTYQVPTLLMKWCLDCHRDPAREVRPRDKVFDMQYEKPREQLELGRSLVAEYQIDTPEALTSCTVCHR
ncbi:MAG TPA: cytochrome c3 family protein [Pirellulales bacterium]|nr:cytochrome c3 family protein [Pirellulales bacterium]